MLALERVEVGPDARPSRRAPRVTRPPGSRGGAGVVGPAGLEDQRRQRRGQLAPAPGRPRAPRRSALGGDAGRARCRSASACRPALGDLVAVEVAERGRARRRPGRTGGRWCWCAARSGARSVSVSRSQLELALGPAGVVLAVGAAVARVRAQLAPRSSLDLARRPPASPPRPPAPRAGGGGVRPWVRLRSVEARSRRDCGLRAVERLRGSAAGSAPRPASGSRPATAGAPAGRR